MDLLGSLFKNKINSKANELLAQRTASQFSEGLQSLVAFMNNGLPAINTDAHNYYETFKTIGAVYECTDLISKKVINSPIVYLKIKDKARFAESKRLEKIDPVQSHVLKALSTEEIASISLDKLLDKPNPYQDRTQWLWTTALIYLLHGNAYIYGNGGAKKRELFTFPNVQIIGDQSNLLDPILGYKFISSDEKPFEKDEIYHLKTANPAPIDKNFQYLYGVPPLRAYLESLRTIKEANVQASKQVKNGGSFGILSPRDKEDQLGPDQKKQLHDKMKEARKSDDEMARVFASSISLLWQNIGLPPAELMLLELVGAKEESVYRAYHVPLSFHNQKASTDNNVATETRKMIYDAVAPVCDAIGIMLTQFVGKANGVDLIQLDYTQLPEMAVNMKDIADYLKALPEGTLTPNEMRACLRYGEKKEEWMNAHYIGNNKTTLQRVFEGTNQPSQGNNNQDNNN